MVFLVVKTTAVHRTTLDIINDILVEAKEKTKKTHLMYRCNLSFKQMLHYLSMLESKELLAPIDGEYQTTDKGRKFIKKFRELGKFTCAVPSQSFWVNIMPRRDGTGPEGKGARTGRGLGNCKPKKKEK